MTADHKTIWLSPACDRCDPERLWCQDDVFEPCDACGRGPSRYALIDDTAAGADQVVLPRRLVGDLLVELAAYHDRDWAGAFFGIDRHTIGAHPKTETEAADCAACKLWREANAAVKTAPARLPPEHVARADELLDALRAFVWAIEHDEYDDTLDQAKELLSDLGVVPGGEDSAS